MHIFQARKNDIPAWIVLMLVWIILMGELSLYALISAPIVSFGCILILHKFLPTAYIQNVNFLKLIFHYITLVGKIYLNGFYVIKIILTKGQADITEVDTNLKNPFLRAVLIHSITLTPGSIPLALEGKKMTVLNLANPNDLHSFEDINKLRQGLEKALIKAEQET
ncbi:MAG: Na+/H+ antiporter subunit E [Lachnospiraceae bacterium]|nr:Na+/H+ antiporter subunit E [Lachnospiraceae bacterium]